MKSPLLFRFAFPGLLFLLVLHSLDVSRPGQWKVGELQRTLRTLAQNIELAAVSTDLSAEVPVHCPNATTCCGIWEVNADRWWTHHPDWEVTSEDDTSFCFSPIPNVTKRAFLRELHWLQWNVDIFAEHQELSLPLPEAHNFTVNCSDMIASVNINSGFGASRPFLLQSFWYAFTRQKPFQTIQKWDWLYAFSNENSTWANCTVHDQTCFYLPVSPCSREDKDLPKLAAFPDNNNETQRMQYDWIDEYMARPNQALRRELLRLRRPLEEQLKQGCVVLHVRRGDVGTPQIPYRRYAAVQEYIDLVENLPANATLFLLTDDVLTIEEVKQHHDSKYNWVYTNKPRVRGVEQGFNHHVPPGSSGPEELAWITVEQDLASTYCHTFAYGTSGFAMGVIKMAERKGHSMQTHFLETHVTAEEVRPFVGKPKEREAHLMKQLEIKQFGSQNKHFG